jgi:hypothetical protein
MVFFRNPMKPPIKTSGQDIPNQNNNKSINVVAGTAWDDSSNKSEKFIILKMNRLQPGYAMDVNKRHLNQYWPLN